jgi:hypothetical protein
VIDAQQDFGRKPDAERGSRYWLDPPGPELLPEADELSEDAAEPEAAEPEAEPAAPLLPLALDDALEGDPDEAEPSPPDFAVFIAGLHAHAASSAAASPNVNSRINMMEPS